MGKISTGPEVPLQPRARDTWKIPKHSPKFKFFAVSLDQIRCGLVLLCSHGDPSDLRTSIWAVLGGFTFGNPKSTHSGLIRIILVMTPTETPRCLRTQARAHWVRPHPHPTRAAGGEGWGGAQRQVGAGRDGAGRVMQEAWEP